MSAPRPDSAGKTRRPMRPLPAFIFMSRRLQVTLCLGLTGVMMISNLLITHPHPAHLREPAVVQTVSTPLKAQD